MHWKGVGVQPIGYEAEVGTLDVQEMGSRQRPTQRLGKSYGHMSLRSSIKTTHNGALIV